MKSLRLLLVIIAQLVNAKSFEINSDLFQGPGDTEARPCKFISVSGSLILLPQRSSYRDVVGNVEKTIFAVNYHETSNFDSVDLVLSAEERLFVVPNVWIELESKLKSGNIIPNVGYDRSYLSVTAIEGNRLTCSFTGFAQRSEAPIKQDFTVIADVGPTSCRFSIEGVRTGSAPLK